MLKLSVMMSIRLAYCQSNFNSGLSTPNCARRFLARCPFSQTHTFPFFPFFFGQHGSEELFAAATVWTCSFCILKWLLSNVWLIISTKPLLPSLPLTTVTMVVIYLLFQCTFWFHFIKCVSHNAGIKSQTSVVCGHARDSTLVVDHPEQCVSVSHYRALMTSHLDWRCESFGVHVCARAVCVGVGVFCWTPTCVCYN